jgi:hypothetical protein
MLPDYKPDPPRMGSFKKVVMLMLLATVAVAGFFLIKPKSPTQIPDYKLQSKIQEPVATAIKNDQSFINNLKSLSKSAGRDKLADKVAEKVTKQADEVGLGLSVEVPERVKKNANLVLVQRLSEYIWKPGSTADKQKRYIPGEQRPFSTPRSEPDSNRGSQNRDSESSKPKYKKPFVKPAAQTKSGIPAMNDR